MKRLLFLYREIRRASGNKICPRHALELADQLLSLHEQENEVDEDAWGQDRDDEWRLIPIDQMLIQEPGSLLKHERYLLDDVYEDDLFYPKKSKRQAINELEIA